MTIDDRTMEKCIGYKKAKIEARKTYSSEFGTQGALAFSRIFDFGYKAGKAHAADHIPEAEKKVDRTMIAAMAMQGLLNATSVERFSRIKPESIAEAAVEYADALIAELGKEEG